MASGDLEAEVTCIICLGIYQDPVTLQCGHSFCQECITRSFDSQVNREYFCPECMRSFSQRPELTRSLRLSNIAKHFHHAHLEQDNTVSSCTYCVHTSVPAVKYCLRCEASLCDVHLRTHNKSPEHALTDPGVSLEDRKCPRHKKVLEYYCVKYDTCVCSECLASDHKGHALQNMELAFVQKMESLENIMENMSSEKKRIDKTLQSLQEKTRDVKKRTSKITEIVDALFRDVNRQQWDLERGILTEIFIQEDQVLQPVNDQMLKVKKEISLLGKQICDCKKMLKTKEPLLFLQVPILKLAENFLSHPKQVKVGEKSEGKTQQVGYMDNHAIFKGLASGFAEIMTNVQKTCECITSHD